MLIAKCGGVAALFIMEFIDTSVRRREASLATPSISGRSARRLSVVATPEGVKPH